MAFTPKTDSYEALKAQITRCYPTLTKQLQRIAHFALDHPDEMALNTVAAVATSIAVQPSSMIRFSNALGYKGFSEMQQVFRGHLVERSGSYRERIAQMRRQQGNGGPARGVDGVLHQFVAASVSGLERLEENVRADDFRKAIRLLAGAQRIYVLAQRRSFPVAYYLNYALNQLDLGAHLIDSVGGMVNEAAHNIRAGEVLVAVSFRNYSPDVVSVAEDCKRRGIPVVAITDTALSPLARSAAVCLELGDEGTQPFRSLVAPLCLAQSLVVALGHLLAERANARPPARKATRGSPAKRATPGVKPG